MSQKPLTQLIPAVHWAAVVQAVRGLILTVTASEPVAAGAPGFVKVQTMVPPAPTVGTVHVAPAGGVSPSKTVPGGVVKSTPTLFSAQTPPTHDSVLGTQLAAVVHATEGEPF